MRLFLFIFFAVLTLLWTYVGLSLIFPVVVGTLWFWPGLLFLGLTYLLQLWRWGAYEKVDEYPRLLIATYFAFGLMCHFLVAALLKDLVGIVYEIPPEGIWTLIALSVILNCLSLIVGMQGPAIKKVEIKTGLQGQPLHIVQISDLHVGPTIREKYVQKVIDQIAPLKPDLIFATGDIGDGKVSLLDKPLDLLKALTVNSKAFYVPGNHEYYWQGDSWVAKMLDLGFTPLLNEGIALDLPNKIPLWLGGVPDPTATRFNPLMTSQPHKAISTQAEGRYKILLAHQPKSCFDAAKAGFDLMMCGHTHGGQFFPFTLLVGFFNPYSRGLNQHGNMKVYVNVGTGYWGPPLRLGARAEITSLVIT